MVKTAGLDLAISGQPSFEVTERLKGNAGTDFGVPSLGASTDDRKIGDVELDRLERILRASWEAFDRAAKAARGKTLRLGPRGGGRDLAKMTAHVVEADEAYITALGARKPKTSAVTPKGMADLHDAAVAALLARARGQPIADPSRVKEPWTPRYFVRRAAWHVLDHAWEIEDRV